MNQYLLWKIEETDTGRDESKCKHTNGNPNSETNLEVEDLFLLYFLWENLHWQCVLVQTSLQTVCNKVNNSHNCVKSSFQLTTKLNRQHALVDETAEWFLPPQKEF